MKLCIELIFLHYMHSVIHAYVTSSSGVQEGVCKGCDNHFQIRHMDLDHVIPKAEGGPDSDENLQLLCSSCNRIKGKKSMEELKSRLKELKIIT